jgi:hypothetical protein
MVRGGNLLILRFVGQRSRSQLLKIEQKFDTFFVSTRYLKNKMSDLNETWYTCADGERRKPIDNEVCRTKVKVDGQSALIFVQKPILEK